MSRQMTFKVHVHSIRALRHVYRNRFYYYYLLSDADKVVNELADFKVLYSLRTKSGSEDIVSDNKHNNGVDEHGEDNHITAESGELNYYITMEWINMEKLYW